MRAKPPAVQVRGGRSNGPRSAAEGFRSEAGRGIHAVQAGEERADAPVARHLVEIEHHPTGAYTGDRVGIRPLLERRLGTRLRDPAERRTIGRQADDDEQAQQPDQCGQDETGGKAGMCTARRGWAGHEGHGDIIVVDETLPFNRVRHSGRLFGTAPRVMHHADHAGAVDGCAGPHGTPVGSGISAQALPRSHTLAFLLP
ncbi:hypothetical protein PUR21_20080 [Methylorubrum rhodesianum]|uniref:Transposase n=1 Tax=Methylorubrum rhodesianum TaxID=29427 RepID=A0ABU9ZEN9_9HYPH